MVARERIRCSNSESGWCTCRWEEIDFSLAPCKPTVRDPFFHPPSLLVSKRSGIYDIPVFSPPWLLTIPIGKVQFQSRSVLLKGGLNEFHSIINYSNEEK